MARRVINENSDYMRGLDGGQRFFSAEEVLRIALAAIQATTERTLAWLEAEYGNSANNREIPLNAIHMVDVIRRCIRDREHLKEQSNAE